MKKRIIALLLIICMAASAASCARKDESVGDVDEGGGYTVQSAQTEQRDAQNEAGGEVGPRTDGQASAEGGSAQSGVKSGGSQTQDTGEDHAVEQAGQVIDTKTSVEYDEEAMAYKTAITNQNAWIADTETAPGGGEFAEIAENGFIETVKQPISTFAADVDTASYTYIRRMIKDGPEYKYFSNAVRIEEMINYFDYDYPKVANGETFAVTGEIFPCPWNKETKLLRLGVSAAEAIPGAKGSNIVLLIDVSGSMSSEDKLPLVKKAFSALAESLGDGDRVSIVTYASGEKVVLDGASSKNKGKILEAIGSLSASGATHGEKGLTQAYEIAEKNFIQGGNNRIILATDGDMNLGITSAEGFRELVEAKRDKGVFISVLGFGTGNLRDTLMETIADCGNGNYYYIDCLDEAQKVLIDQMQGTLYTVAKDVKFQAEFDAGAVAEYRLVGYENRVMANEDFEDDKKDGGELGSGNRVTVLYELKPTGQSEKDYAKLSVRYKKPDGDKSELKTFAFGKSHETEKPTEDSVFAAAVAQFGMLIRESKYAAGTGFDDVINAVKDLKCVKNDRYKAEFLALAEIIKNKQ